MRHERTPLPEKELMSDLKITGVDVELFTVPLAEVLSDAMHGDHTHFELITATVHRSDGCSGTGYTYTGGRGGHAVKAMLCHDLVPFVLGRDGASIDALYDAMQTHIHYVGRGGIASFAISALDIAMWDLRGQSEGRSLLRMAGGSEPRARAYCGGIDLNFPIDKLLSNVEGYLARGAKAVKIKVGRADLSEDVERARAVRNLLGPDRTFMVDANYALSVERAIEAARAFAEFDIEFFEEPIIPDDFLGYAAIADATGVPIAMGENLHTLEEFCLAAELSKLAFIQPDASNCGGVTGWLRAARAFEGRAVPVCSHGMQELHISLVASQQHAGWVELHSFPIDEYTTRPVVLESGQTVAPDVPGIGVTFDWDKLRPHRVL